MNTIEHKIQHLLSELAYCKANHISTREIENALWIALQLLEPPSSDKYMDKIYPNTWPCSKQLEKIRVKGESVK